VGNNCNPVFNDVILHSIAIKCRIFTRGVAQV
jgi:hypothetical protein